MGSAALNCASLGIPTILLDISYKEVKGNYKFTWLHNRDGYTLGDKLNNKNLYKNNQSLERCINEYLEKPELISKMSYQYVVENHSLERVSNLLLENIKKSSLSFNPNFTNKFLRKGLLYSIFKILFGSRFNQP